MDERKMRLLGLDKGVLAEIGANCERDDLQLYSDCQGGVQRAKGCVKPDYLHNIIKSRSNWFFMY